MTLLKSIGQCKVIAGCGDIRVVILKIMRIIDRYSASAGIKHIVTRALLSQGNFLKFEIASFTSESH
jgi:hypothetical protein